MCLQGICLFAEGVDVMRKMIILAGAAAMAALPAMADAQGRGHGRGHGANAVGNRHGGAHCPPGLANRNPPCMPPGQARHLYNRGQRLPADFRDFVDYGRLPLDLRDRYDIPRGYRYIYRDNSVYLVDPTTRLVQDIIDMID
jgi:Ni/Co efflux regulator RcnB